MNKYITSRYSIKEQAYFAKRLSFLIHAGLPIVDSLRIVHRQTKSSARAKVLDRVIADVSSGKFLSTSLERLKGGFGEFAINIIKIGETTGTLDQNLNYLADELKKRSILRQKILTAFIYPIFIAVSTLGLTGLLTIFIFPKIRPVFDSLHVDLPLSTKFLIFLSNFLRNYGLWFMLAMVCMIIFFTIIIKKIEKIRVYTNWIIIRLPIAGNIIINYNLANFCRTLGLLLKGGVRIMDAIKITSDTTSNIIYKNEITRLINGVRKGDKISKHLEKNPTLFPDILTQTVAVGEVTGKLPDTLMYTSELYENELDELTKNLSSTIEPLLMIFMGLVVGFVAISVITPIYEITNNLKR